MKKGIWILGMLFFALLSTTAIVSCEKDDDTPIENNCNLTTEQEEGLLYMREEEKLARDVYNYLYEKWNLNVFKNIGKAEQKHMDALLGEVDVCKFEDSVLPEAGKFNNTHIQELYDALTTKGDKSLVDALEVGATIEDVDIFDLDNYSAKTDSETLLKVYDNLNCGSRNHMRAFIGQLESQGVTYTPQFISQDQFDEILKGDHESCGQ